MSIPVVEIEHESICNACVGGGICQFCSAKGCTKSCPACAVEANNKAWAKYLTGLNHDDGGRVTVYIPSDDWEQIKKLAEEKTHG